MQRACFIVSPRGPRELCQRTNCRVGKGGFCRCAHRPSSAWATRAFLTLHSPDLSAIPGRGSGGAPAPPERSSALTSPRAPHPVPRSDASRAAPLKERGGVMIRKVWRAGTMKGSPGIRVPRGSLLLGGCRVRLHRFEMAGLRRLGPPSPVTAIPAIPRNWNTTKP
jgi:hypothetical protein